MCMCVCVMRTARRSYEMHSVATLRSAQYSHTERIDDGCDSQRLGSNEYIDLRTRLRVKRESPSLLNPQIARIQYTVYTVQYTVSILILILKHTRVCMSNECS